MARRAGRARRWTATGQEFVQAAAGVVQLPLLVEPRRALADAGWSVDVGGTGDGRVWGVAHRQREDGTRRIVSARGRSAGAVEEALWVAVQATEAQEAHAG